MQAISWYPSYHHRSHCASTSKSENFFQMLAVSQSIHLIHISRSHLFMLWSTKYKAVNNLDTYLWQLLKQPIKVTCFWFLKYNDTSIQKLKYNIANFDIKKFCLICVGFNTLEAINVKCWKMKVANDVKEKHLYCLLHKDVAKILFCIKAYPIILF